MFLVEMKFPGTSLQSLLRVNLEGSTSDVLYVVSIDIFSSVQEQVVQRVKNQLVIHYI